MNDSAVEFAHKKYPNEPVRFGSNDLEPFVIWCVEQKVSDITIQNEEQIFCEIHGKMHRVTNRRLSKSELVDLISKIYKGDGAVSKLNGGGDVDLQWTVRVDRNTVLRFRVNMTAIFTDGQKGYQITIRTINGRAPLLETLNLPQEIIDNVSPKQGLIIISGATGSGKSTLLASVLDWRMRLSDAHLKILTYESPIEYVYDDVPKPTTSIAQTEIGTHLESFAIGVRNALRRKPSIILMGELRDKETIGEGVTASMTGHLVYGTLHSNGVSDAIRRMVNVFDAEEKAARAVDILTSLKLVVSQMLLPAKDGTRVAIREYLVFNQEVVNSLLETEINNLTHETRKMLIQHGKTFLQDAEEKYKNDLIDKKWYEEILKITEGSKK
jgi:defect-in-organelle-trafficking protein DotB